MSTERLIEANGPAGRVAIDPCVTSHTGDAPFFYDYRDLVIHDLAADLAAVREDARAFRELAVEAIHELSKLRTLTYRQRGRITELCKELRAMRQGTP